MVKLFQAIYEQWRKNRKEKFDHGDIIDLDGYELESGMPGGRSVGLSNSSMFMDIVISGFLFVWFIFGNYLVSSIFIVSHNMLTIVILFLLKVFKIWMPNFKQPMYDIKKLV